MSSTIKNVRDQSIPQEKVIGGIPTVAGEVLEAIITSVTSGTALAGDVGGTLGATVIQAGAITTTKIDDGAVTTVKVADGAITDAKINDVAYSKITGAPTSLPPSGGAGGSLDGTYPSPSIRDGAVDTDQLHDDAVTTPKLADGSVLASKIADGAVTSNKIADGTIVNADISATANIDYSKLSGTPSALPPNGSAGGDLGGSYPNPTVTKASGAFALPGDISPAAIAAQADDLNPTGLSGATVLRLTNNAPQTITGLAGGADGRVIILRHEGGITPGRFTLAAENISSVAGNRFGFDTDVYLYPYQALILHYDATASRWRSIADPGIVVQVDGAESGFGATRVVNFTADRSGTASLSSVTDGVSTITLGAATQLIGVNTSIPSGNTIVSTSSETAFSSSGSIAGGTLAVGDVIRITLRGTYGTSSGSPTLNLRIKIGSTTVIATGSIPMASSLATTWGWSAEILMIVDTIGSSGTLEVQGQAQWATASTTNVCVNMAQGSTVTIDTTASQSVTATVQWSASSANNTITLRQLVVEHLRA